jgi:carbonic anhydrase
LRYFRDTIHEQNGRENRRRIGLRASRRVGRGTKGARRLGCAAMSVIDELIANNDRFAASLPAKHLDVEPSRRLAIVTCMDSRLDVFAALGLKDGEAHVLRNAGGVIADDVIRSLAVSQRRLGTREVMLIHHTDCGMQKLTDDGFRSELMEATGVAPAFAIESFADVDADVRQSILRVRRSAFLPHRDSVRGFVYDVDTHRLREVAAGDA